MGVGKEEKEAEVEASMLHNIRQRTRAMLLFGLHIWLSCVAGELFTYFLLITLYI